MISNTAQINTFTSGMDTDTDINLLPNNKYRYAQDVRITTDDQGTTGVLQSVEGAKKYNFNIKTSEEILGTATINDIAIVITKLANDINKVYRITNFDSPDLISTVILQGKLGLGKDENYDRLSIVLNYETDTNIKAYIADGKSIIKVINIMDDKYVYKSGVDNPYLDSDGNILNPKNLDIIPSATLPPFEVTEMATGNLKAGMVQYCYRLYNKHSQQTSLSSLSNCVHLDSSDVNSTLINHYGSGKGDSTGKGCTLEAPYTDKTFSRCIIIRIFYEDNNTTPTYTIADDIELDSRLNTISYTDTGSSSLGVMTQEEFNAFTSYAFICNNITSLQNRLFAANIKEESWIPVIEQDGKVVEYDARAYRANLDGRVRLETASSTDYLNFPITDYDTMKKIPIQHDCINPFNTNRDSFTKDGNSYVYGLNGEYGGNGVNISYSFINVELNEAYSPTKGSDLIDNIGLDNKVTFTQDIPIYSLDRDFIQNESIDGVSRQLNYADPIIASKYRSYQRDEIYRFGIVFYNDKGIPSPVLWIGDIRFPNLEDSSIIEQKSNDILISKALGIRFNIKNFPSNATAYEIVRCDRTANDKTIISQGAITPIYNYRIIEDREDGEIGAGQGDKDTNEYRPTIFLHTKQREFLIRKTGGMTFNQYKVTTSQFGVGYWRFISPEVCFNGKNVESQFNDSIYIQNICLQLSHFDRSVVTAPDGKSTQNWFAINKYATRVDGTQYNTSSVRPNIRTWIMDSSNAMSTYVVDLGEDDWCNAYMQKFYYRGAAKNLGNQQKITTAKYPDCIPYNAVQNGGVKPYKLNIGDITYSNWATSRFSDTETVCVYGPAGPCLIMQIDQSDKYNIQPVSWSYENSYNDDCALWIVNVKRDVAPYNGNTYSARASSTYIPVGAYRQILTNVDNTMPYEDPRTLNVFGGDTYIGILDYPCQMIFQRNDAEEWSNAKKYIGAYIPVESTINLKLSMGQMTNRTYNAATNTVNAYMQLEPVQMQTYHTQSKPFYLYNDVYSNTPNGKLFATRGLYDESDVKSPNRVYVSQAKTANENIDNWSVFKPADYIDVDAQYGQITNIKGIFNRLYFWQDGAFGILSVNERSLIQDNNIGQLVLGTGGVLDRYDYLSILNGTSIINDDSITNSDSNIYWYDVNKNEICKYGSNGVSIISKECNVQSYVNNMYSQKTRWANSLYDKKYDEVWFRLYNKSLIYNERLNVFTSLYTFDPDFTLPFRDKVVTTKSNDFYIINSLNIDGFGDTDKDIKLQTVVNKDAQYTKVFDNIAIQGEFVAPNNEILRDDILESIKLTTKHQTATKDGQELKFDYREDTYRLPVPRQDIFEEDVNMSFPARMRGKYMICDYKFRSDKDYTFQIPQITTTYRYSRI